MGETNENTKRRAQLARPGAAWDDEGMCAALLAVHDRCDGRVRVQGPAGVVRFRGGFRFHVAVLREATTGWRADVIRLTIAARL